MSGMSIVMVVLFGLFALVSLPLVVVVAKAAAQRQRDGLERVAHHLFGPGQFGLRSRRGDAYTLLILPVGGPTGLYIGRRGWLQAPRHLRKPDAIEPTGKSAIDEVFEIGALDAAVLGRVTGSAALLDALWRVGSIGGLERSAAAT